MRETWRGLTFKRKLSTLSAHKNNRNIAATLPAKQSAHIKNTTKECRDENAYFNYRPDYGVADIRLQ
jgi:hypothetical protein